MVLGVSETWLDGSINDVELEIAGFKSYKKDRDIEGVVV